MNTTSPTACICTPTFSPTLLPTILNISTPSPTQDSITAAYSANSAELVSQIQYAVPIGLAMIIIYCILRRLHPNTWEIRRKLSVSIDDDDDGNDNDFDIEKSDEHSSITKKPKITFPEISSGYFLWMYDVWMMDSNTFYITIG